MANIKIDLEKRIFVMFFIITFLLVFTLILIEYQLARFGIRQNEDININGALTEYQIARTEINNQVLHEMQRIAINPAFLDSVEKQEYDTVSDLLAKIDSSINIKNILILTNDKEIIYGNSWDLIDRYLADIFNKYSSSFHGQFYAGFGKKAYSIYYTPFYIDDNFAGLIINNKEFILSDLELEKYRTGYISTIEVSPEFDLSSNVLLKDRNYLVPSLKQRAENLINQDIVRYKSDMAYGMVIDYDINSKPSNVFILPYPRNVYLFAQQSVLIFTLILFALTVIMISLLGNWFSKTILHPIKEVSDKMDIISGDPTKNEPIKSNYVGVLGSLIKTFNFMNKSINEYSTNLREYKVISDNIDSGFFWLNSEFQIVISNMSLYKIFNIDEKTDIKGLNINDHLELNQKQLEIARTEGLALPQWEIFSGVAKKYVVLNIIPVESKSKICLVGTITDISTKINERLARESLEMELIKSNRLAEIGRRIEGIVHNINSPLNTILGYAQLMRKNNKESRDLEKIIEAGKNISHLVKGLLNKAKADSSSMIRPLDINELINQELELCNHNLFFKHYVDLELELGEKLPAVKAVYGDISLCIANVINNAIESLENRIDKFIKVKTYKDDEMLAISIEDTGQGIPIENREAIFEPYFTTKNRDGGKGSGFGLGLAISKNVVDKYDGRIELISEEDKGSKFIIYLPVM